MTEEADLSLLVDALDSLNEGIQVISPELRYLYLNEAAARQGRKARSALVGKTMPECYPGIEATPMFATLRRCMSERCLETLENEFVYDDGSRAWFELRLRPFRGGLVIASLDVTERKGIEQRLQDAYRQALRDLVTPVVRVHERVLLVPIVGALDAPRADEMAKAVLTRVVADRAKVVIFDIAGVPEVDTSAANHLLQTTAMIRLVGAKTVISGVSAATANTIVHLGLDLSGIETTAELAEGIALALSKVR